MANHSQKCCIVVGAAISAAIAVVFAFLNVQPTFEDRPQDAVWVHDDWMDEKHFGWPETFCILQIRLDNRREVFTDGHSLRQPWRPPQWSRQLAWDGEALLWNLYWLGIIVIPVWLIAGLNYHKWRTRP